MLKGGSSLERQVSLRSGARVEDALGYLDHDVESIDVGSDLVDRLKESKPDVVFIALHGRGGEDGTVQEILEILGLPYTGSGIQASIRCMDKVLAKYALIDAGISTPDFFAFNERAFSEFGAATTLPEIEERLGFPVVVKPSAQGSALGIKFAASTEDVPGALVAAFSYDDKVILERYVKGRELAVGLLETEDGLEALPVVEALPHEGSFFDFESRYEIGKTDYVCPAELSEDVTTTVQEIASDTFRTLGCYGFSRVDLMLPEDGPPQVLEANAIPGLTETSLFPQAAEAGGIAFQELVSQLIALALARTPSTVS